MSGGIQFPPINLAGATVGQQFGPTDLSTFWNNDPSNTQKVAYLHVFNDSGCGLAYNFNNGGGGYIMAGGWRNIPLNSGVQTITYTVQYTLPNPPVSLLFATFYSPTDAIPEIGQLGNSTVGIGGSVQTSSVQTLSNEGNAANLLVIDIGDSGHAQLYTLYTDGHLLWSVDQSGTLHQVVKVQTSGNPLQLGAAGDIVEVLGQILVDQLATFTGNIVANGGMNLGTLRDDTTGATQATLLTAGITIQNLLTLLAGLKVAGNIDATTNNTPLRFMTTGAVLQNTLWIDASNITTLEYASEAAGGLFIDDPSGNPVAAFTRPGGSGQLAVRTVAFQNGSLNRLATGTVSIGATSSVVVNHGMNAAPAQVLAVTDQATSSGTCSAHSYTATQFTLFNGAGATLTYRWWASG